MGVERLSLPLAVGCIGVTLCAGVPATALAGSAPHQSAVEGCRPSPTLPGVRLDGRVEPRAPRLVGRGPLMAGPFHGPRALLRVSGGLASKLYYQLSPTGPSTITVRARRLDAPGRGLFEVQRTDVAGRSVRIKVPVLRLRLATVRRENPPHRGDVLLGQPGSLTLPGLGCYQLQVRWAGGGWSRTFVARLDPRAAEPLR